MKFVPQLAVAAGRRVRFNVTDEVHKACAGGKLPYPVGVGTMTGQEGYGKVAEVKWPPRPGSKSEKPIVDWVPREALVAA